MVTATRATAASWTSFLRYNAHAPSHTLLHTENSAVLNFAGEIRAIMLRSSVDFSTFYVY